MPSSRTKRHRRSSHSHTKKTPASPTSLLAPQEACARAQQIILRHWPDIIQAQVEKALDGSHQHAKYLGEYAGLSAALAAPAGEQDESLAALLLKRLDIVPEADLPAADHAPVLE